MAPHSSNLAWNIPWMEEPGGLQSTGSRRVRHDWAPSLSLFTFMHWRRKWQPTPVFLPGESQGWGSLVGCCLWGRTGSDTTEAMQQQQQQQPAVTVRINWDNMKSIKVSGTSWGILVCLPLKQDSLEGSWHTWMELDSYLIVNSMDWTLSRVTFFPP